MQSNMLPKCVANLPPRLDPISTRAIIISHPHFGAYSVVTINSHAGESEMTVNYNLLALENFSTTSNYFGNKFVATRSSQKHLNGKASQ